MISLTEHLASAVIVDAHWSDEEFRHEFELMAIRNQAAGELVRGEISVDVYEDILDQCGIDPISWLKEVEKGIDKDPNYAISY